MNTKPLIVGTLAALLLGNSLPLDPPSILKPFIENGALKTDDLTLMRGAFDDASDQQKADWEAVKDWLKMCLADAKSKALDDLKALGVAEAELDIVPIGPALCGTVATLNHLPTITKNWEEFSANQAKARQIFLIYRYGAGIARENMPYETAWGNEAAWDLLSMTVWEQVYRRGHGWTGRADAPKIDPALEPYLNAFLGVEMTKADRKNSEYLKKLVADKGWPSIPMVGKRASANAWLIVQHADHDPAFQLQALRLMEPLAAKGEVTKPNYAYLYDRIMLKLTGKQRFGTQFLGCDGEAHKLRPLEDESKLDALRVEYELGPISDYRKMMRDRFGPCRAS